MTDPQTVIERIEQFETATKEATEAVRERERTAEEAGEQLATLVADAVSSEGTNVEAVANSTEPPRFRFEARLDRAAMVATLTDALPAGFVVSHVNQDGSLSIEWTGSNRTPTGREHDAVLKAIIAEETVTEDDGLISSVPTRSDVLARAETLNIPREAASNRLERLSRLNMVDISDGEVYPGKNFSRV
jgi:hypothetical protein